MTQRSWVYVFLILGLLFFCTVASADTCYTKYRLLGNCTDRYLPVITAPPNTTANDAEESFPEIKSESEDETSMSSGIVLSPQGGGQGISATGTGTIQTEFGATFSSPTTSFRNSEIYRAHGLFDLQISQGYQGG